MEVHVVDAGNRHLYDRLIDENFRRRAEIFVDEMRWRHLRKVDGRERDQFDTSEATYYLAVEHGRVLGGIRRHCSLLPTLLSEVFPHLASRGFERAADVYEGTRLYIVPERRTEHPNKISGVLHWAAWAHTLQQGGRAIQLVTWATYVPFLMRSGLRPRPLGLPTDHDGMQLVAVVTSVDASVLMELLAFYDIDPVPLITAGMVTEGRNAA